MKHNPYTYDEPTYSKDLFYLHPLPIIIIGILAIIWLYHTEPQQVNPCQPTESETP